MSTPPQPPHIHHAGVDNGLSDELQNAAVNFIFKRIGTVRRTGEMLEAIK